MAAGASFQQAAAPGQQQFQLLADKFDALTITGFNPASLSADALPRPRTSQPATDVKTVEPASRLKEVNAHTNFVRMTTNFLPNSASVRNMWKLPLGAIVQPMHEIVGDMQPIPIINFGRCGVVRCKQCRTYINPFVSFTDAGRRWRCSRCGSLKHSIPSDLTSLSQRNPILNPEPSLTQVQCLWDS